MAALVDRPWFRMLRGWMREPVFRGEPFTEREAYIWSMEQAAYADHDQWFCGIQVWVQRGEFVTSINDMAEKFGWGTKRVRLFLDRMVRADKWETRKAYDGTKAPTVISVCGYCEIQATPRG